MELNQGQFSQREREVIELLLQGKSNKQIAFALGVSESTVEYHLKNIYQKLEVNSRTEAVLRLGKSIGNDMPSELRKSSAVTDNKPISKPKMPPNNLYRWIAIVLVIALVAVSSYSLWFRKNAEASPCGPQDLAIDPIPDTPNSLVTPQSTDITWQDQIVYGLDPIKTGRNLAGIRQQVSYLKGLGITSVLLGPVFSDQDFMKVDPRLGTNEELVLLIEEFHSTTNGPRINVILKLAMASTGTEHDWFTYPELYPRHYRTWNADNEADNIAGTPLSQAGPLDHWAFGPLINHTHGIKTKTGTYADVRNTIFGLVDTFDFDGFQYASAGLFCAAFWPTFMSDFHERYDKTKPDFWHIAEVFILGTRKSWQIPLAEFVNQTSSVGLIAMDGAIDFPLQTFIQDVAVRGISPNCVSMFCVPLVNHLISPDGIRNPERLAASIDQLNGSFIEAVDDGNLIERLRLASVLLMTINRVPLIQSGHEYGIDVTSLEALFAKNLDEAFHEYFKKLIQIRRDNPAFRRGSITRLDTNANIMSFARQYEGRTFIVVLNLVEHTHPDFEIHLGAQGIICSRVTNILAEDQNIQLDNSGTDGSLLSVTLDAWEPKILHCE